MSPLQPTVVYQNTPTAAVPEDKVRTGPRADIGFIAGGPRFADETARLLQARLTAVAFAASIILSAAFVANLVAGIYSLLPLRVALLLILITCFGLLRGFSSLPLPRLRILELVVFGTAGTQLTVLMLTRTNVFVAEGDATSAVAVRYFIVACWCVLILSYGIFMPNSWRRGAVVMSLAAAVPYAVMGVQQWLSPELSLLLAKDQTHFLIPLPIVAALAGTYGTHIINAARREAFKARQFGQYRLMERLGVGGMGEVYKAEHVLLKRPCAIKLIRPESEADANAIARFEKEVKATAKLTHWNTIEIYDYGHTSDGAFYYVMELLTGMSLQELVERQGPLPPERVVHLLRQVCGALREAHSVGLIHRDIKPANIFAARRGGIFDVAKLLDFGLVKESVDTPPRNGEPTGFGTFSGTPLYASPEQASAFESVDARADLYSLGAVAYFLLTGRPPFLGKTMLEVLNAHVRLNPDPPSKHRPGIPPDVDHVVMTCLAKKPEARHPDAASLIGALSECACADQWKPEHAAASWLDPAAKSDLTPTTSNVTINYTDGKV